METESTNFHVDYLDVYRHWCANSEKYAGGDALITAYQQGWKINTTVYVEEHWHAGTRPVTVYYMDMERNGEQRTMPVLNNPYVRRFLRQMKPTIRPIAEREAMLRKQRKAE